MFNHVHANLLVQLLLSDFLELLAVASAALDHIHSAGEVGRMVQNQSARAVLIEHFALGHSVSKPFLKKKKKNKRGCLKNKN